MRRRSSQNGKEKLLESLLALLGTEISAHFARLGQKIPYTHIPTNGWVTVETLPSVPGTLTFPPDSGPGWLQG